MVWGELAIQEFAPFCSCSANGKKEYLLSMLRFNTRLITLVLLLVTGPAALAFASPAIKFYKTEIELGKLLAGITSRASFQFANTGDENLKIRQVNGPCDCMEVKATDTEIAPGKSSAIEVVIKTSGYEGALAKEITVVTNDPDHPVLELAIKCEVEPIATLAPERLNFGTIKPRTVIERVLTITPIDAETFGIKNIESVGAHVSVKEVRKSGNSKGTQALTILVSAGDTPGRVLERVRVITTLPGNPVIEFLVFGNIDEEVKDAKHS